MRFCVRRACVCACDSVDGRLGGDMCADSVALVQEREREGNLKAISSGRILTEARGCVCARAM
jgi:hypothetical protein